MNTNYLFDVIKLHDKFIHGDSRFRPLSEIFSVKFKPILKHMKFKTSNIRPCYYEIYHNSTAPHKIIRSALKVLTNEK